MKMSSPEVVAKPEANSFVTKAESASAQKESPPPSKPAPDQGPRSHPSRTTLKSLHTGEPTHMAKRREERDRHASVPLPTAVQPPLRQESREEDRRNPVSCSPSTRPPQEHAGPAKRQRPPAPPAREKTAATKSHRHRHFWPQPGRRRLGGAKQPSDPDESGSHERTRSQRLPRRRTEAAAQICRVAIRASTPVHQGIPSRDDLAMKGRNTPSPPSLSPRFVDVNISLPPAILVSGQASGVELRRRQDRGGSSALLGTAARVAARVT